MYRLFFASDNCQQIASKTQAATKNSDNLLERKN